MERDQRHTSHARSAVVAFAREQRLPESFEVGFFDWYAGAVAHFAKRVEASNGALLVGVSGCQGSGKSTLAKAMAEVATSAYGVPAIALSLDDFYLTRAARRILAERVHPLFGTRGVPGTHDLELLAETLGQLAECHDGVALPAFDKARDDRTGMVHWRQVGAPVRLIFLEGWCVGIPPQAEAELDQPVNEIEAEWDPDQVWRREVNRQLAGGYSALFETLDALLFLRAPSFNAVFEWRWEQERKLSDALRAARRDAVDTTMSREQVADFVLHYQRLTEHALSTLAKRSDVVWALQRDRSVRQMQMMAVAA
ncbi:MAG: phosphoribulokinase [Luminiphilus sp.]|jgi:D-glycerate 3-kinase|nr:phosphoribulokinase [Luminiphilus sp.]